MTEALIFAVCCEEVSYIGIGRHVLVNLTRKSYNLAYEKSTCRRIKGAVFGSA